MVRTVIAAVLSLCAAHAAGAASPWSESAQTSVRLTAAATAVGTGDSVPLGLHFRMDPGWKIYWRSPGDAGFPPRVDWTGSANLATAEMFWPVPERFSILGIDTVGYKDEVVLPIRASVVDPTAPLDLRAKIDYLTCSDICVPRTAEVALTLPPGPAGSSLDAHLIDRFAATVPSDGAAHGLTIGAVAVSGAKLRVAATSTTPFADPDIFVEGPDSLWFAKPAVRLSDRGRRLDATLAVDGADALPGGLAGTTVTLTLVDGRRGAERTLALTAGTLAAPAPPPGLSLVAVLALALLGGLILNLMPCVLPVLSIKLLGVVSHGGGAPAPVRRGFLASAAGIVFSFLVLAAGLIGLKAAGQSIGWGIQFQNPWFLVVMALVVTAFACNLWGFFEIRLPGRLADFGGGAEAPGLSGHFLTGALATLLATPCSAPFLGTAVGFALSRGAAEIMLVFAVLGVGLALPYLLVAAVPTLATRLPRPGRWMVVLRRVLGVALAGTALWLVSILWTAIGTDGALTVAGALAVLIAILAVGRRSGGRRSVVGAAFVAALALAVPALVTEDEATARTASDHWATFDRAAIAGLVADGRTVFVDVTADWCVTCVVNKGLVLDTAAVRERLDSAAVVAMQADWTRPDDAISAYLAAYGRYGIPFNAVYGPGAPDGIVLPELLTTDAVFDALDRASSH